MSRPPSITVGMRFGRLVVVADSGVKASYGDRLWDCTCDCGSTIRTVAYSLKSGRTTSCGCRMMEESSRIIRAYNSEVGHGLRFHPLYKTWDSMIRRCLNPAQPRYRDYGGRGITVCERWRGLPDGLRNFIEDVGERPSPKHSLDRINNDGNYEPANCRWATASEQAYNRRPKRY